MDAALLEGGGIISGLTKPVYPVFFPVSANLTRETGSKSTASATRQSAKSGGFLAVRE